MGLFDTALEKLRQSPQSRDLRLGQSIEVVAAYGEMLERTSAEQGVIGDAHELPYAKDAIRHALQILMRSTREAPLRETLRIGYMRLADWQSADESAHVPIHFGHRTTLGNPLELAKQLAADRDPGNRLRAAAKAEQQALLDELRRLKL